MNKLVTFAPHVPADWEYLGIHNVPIGATQADVLLDRDDQSLRLRMVNHGKDVFTLDFAPAYSPFTKINRAKFNGQNVRWTEDRQSTDSHPHFKLQIKPGENILAIEHRGTFGYVVAYVPPELGAQSTNLKVISERWSGNGATLELALSGRAGHANGLNLPGSDRVSSVSEARQQGGNLVVEMPPDKRNDYVMKTVTIRLG